MTLQTSSVSASFKWLAPLLLLSLCPDNQGRFAFAFDFTYGAPTSCDPLNVSWTGGRAPFYLLITPLFIPSQNISIPVSAFDEQTQNGSFSTQLGLSAGQRFLLTMSDADGFGSGGVSNLLTTGSSISGSDCNTTAATPPFTFATPDAFQQCSDFIFTGYNGSTQPNTIKGLIPLGQIISLTTSPGSDSLTWTVNIQSGTEVVFLMTDSEGRSGGTSDLETVSASNDATCLNASSPHSTASAASQTSAPHETQTVQVKSGMEPGEIAGIVLGALAVMLLAIALAVFLLRRRRRCQQAEEESRPQIVQVGGGLSSNSSRLSRIRGSIVPSSRRRTQHVDLITTHSSQPSSYSTQRPSHFPLHSSQSLPLSNNYEVEPYQLPSDASAMDGHSSARDTYTDVLGHVSHSSPRSQSHQNSRSSNFSSQPDVPNSPTGFLPNPHTHSRHPSLHQSLMSTTQSPKGSVRNSAPRFILHTDAEDPSIQDEEADLVELPPQYTDRRNRPSEQSSDVKELSSPE
ncbi:hypothetical protein SCHPADRAFT_996977 [Schizopora paradoxa]|uniref:Mid2 domain-containing protein n=1 Tax=Schizopora paradoxa TaxID=27342 RepID=A0A0H2RPV0_9AGAM|nr:hypothetical protein SCHPADRAFT_996977 [Schizopora paradoxa]